MSDPRAILLVDDETGFRENVAERLKSLGYEVIESGDGDTALARAKEKFIDAALLDIVMPGMDGITLMAKLKELDAFIEVVMMTGQGSIESAVDAMQRGAYHYVTKPVKLKEIEMVVRRAVEKSKLARQNNLFSDEIRRLRKAAHPDIVAESAAMKHILDESARIAQTRSTVLIDGETGTGKEVVAEYIHRMSPRRGRAFSVLNCGAITENLIDPELFGYEKGAFTGAAESRPGLVEVTDGGTLFLDEIGEMSPAGQVRLLRFLERGLFRRVGSTRERSVDVRVIAATNRNIEKEISNGKFREDLFHRLNVFRLTLPPLRLRPDDIPPLAEYFLSRLGSPAAPRKILAPQSLETLRAYPWPGNVRELAHTIERAWFAEQRNGAGTILPEHLALPVAVDTHPLVSLGQAEERHIRAVLAAVAGNRKAAAGILGVTERHLYRLLQKFGL